MTDTPAPPTPRGRRRPHHPTVGPRLSRWLAVVFALFALLSVNSVYLSTITWLQFRTGEVYENTFYLGMFLFHLVLGFVLIVPVLVFGTSHLLKARTRPNRRAVKVGYALFGISLLLLLTGVLLTRIEGILEIRDGTTRRLIYWAHVGAPFVAAWLFVLHRLAGRRILWRTGAKWAGAGAALVLPMVLLHSQDPRAWNRVGPESGEEYFFPSLARTVTGDFIPAESLMQDQFCLKCHEQAHEGWRTSSHRFASFNNPVYLFSVRETREISLERDGSLQAARFCAGCHDPVPFFSGAFDDPAFDDVHDPTSQAGITCTVCHTISNINSHRGNADYTIDEPARYPFARSDSALGQWVREQLIKAKPALHKRTYLKPFHKTADFCGVCHKVHLPEELNKYKWLRGQNHYDAHRLSGVSGHGITSFYYPPSATPDCNSGNCHMNLIPSTDFAAKDFAGDGTRAVHDHSFPSANTAIPHLLDFPEKEEVNARHRAMTEGSLRVDLFGLRRGETIDSPLEAPLRPVVPSLRRGEAVLLEFVLRTLTLGHTFTQGTSDSNEIWLEVSVTSDGRAIGSSGGRGEDGAVDPWSHFVNAYVLDREGRRIDRRNAQDIFIPLYNNQIPPGAADVVRYLLNVPEESGDTVTVTARLLYRKFDTRLLQYVYGDDRVNDLPIMEIARDSVTFPVDGEPTSGSERGIVEWQRWNDYGIGLLRKGGTGAVRGELPSAIGAFDEVARLGRPDGPLNRARAELQAGRIDAAASSLERASKWDPPAPPWSLAWFGARVLLENGFYEDALASLEQIAETRWPEARARKFDFSRDDRVWNQIAAVHFAIARRTRTDEARRTRHLEEARAAYERSLTLDSESVPAHYGLAQVHAALGDTEAEQHHRALHARYKVDDFARDRAFATHRGANPAADHAAEAIVIYDLHREGAPPIAD
ncbi:MAG: tetratricopeptide repeat protein [Planctomycetota bacterium]|jgi:hypothetical protein